MELGPGGWRLALAQQYLAWMGRLPLLKTNTRLRGNRETDTRAGHTSTELY